MEQLEKLYSSDGIYGSLTYGSPLCCRGLKCAVFLTQFGTLKGKKILCVGSGNGYEAVWFVKAGCDVTVLELYHPKLPILEGKQIRGYAQDLPFEDNEFNLYFCCEMMEHVPEELTIPILKEAKRVSGEVFFTIADRGDPPYNTHINIHDMPYWYFMFKQLGFEIINVQTKPRFPILNVTKEGITLFSCADGTLIHAGC